MRRLIGPVAALGASAWGAVLSLISVPIYLHRLGIEAVGVIGFFISLQAVLQILDLGLAPTVNREVARAKALGDEQRARTLLATLARIYWMVGSLLAVLIALTAKFIAGHYLNGSGGNAGHYATAIMLMGVLVGVRWPIAVYQNALIGFGWLGTASGLSMATSGLAFACSVAAITLYSPTVEMLFAAQTAATAIMVLVYAVVAWRAVGKRALATIDLRALKPIWKFSIGMSGVTLTGIALTQLDKALLIKLLPLASFGRYMIAVNVVAALAVFVTPLMNIIFPRLSALVAADATNDALFLYAEGSRLFAAAYLPIVFALGLYSFDLISLWTGDARLAGQLVAIVAFLCVGWGINGVMYFPYCLQLANGLSQLPLLINLMLLAVFAPLVWGLTYRYGALGGAIAWAALQAVYLFVGALVTHWRLRLGSGFHWVGNTVALPAILCAALFALTRPVVTLAAPGSLPRLAMIVAAVLTAQLGCVLLLRLPRILPRLRVLITEVAPA